MMIDCFLAAGLTDFRIDIGQTEFYRGMIEQLDVSDETAVKIHELIENKNSLGMELLLSDLDLDAAARRLLLEYDELYGDVQMLSKAQELAVGDRCLKAIDRLLEVYEVIRLYGYEDYVGFDLGMVNYYEYYTGIIFRGYTYGTGDAIGKGGRYDNLLIQFGKHAPAIGFTILVDELMLALDRQSIPVSLRETAFAVLLYHRKDRETAISLAAGLRQDGIRTELSSLEDEGGLEAYLDFIFRQGAGAAFVLDEASVTIYKSGSGGSRCLTLEQFREEY